MGAMFKALKQLSNTVKHLLDQTKNTGISDIKIASMPKLTATVCDLGKSSDEKKYKKHAPNWP